MLEILTIFLDQKANKTVECYFFSRLDKVIVCMLEYENIFSFVSKVMFPSILSFVKLFCKTIVSNFLKNGSDCICFWIRMNFRATFYKKPGRI